MVDDGVIRTDMRIKALNKRIERLYDEAFDDFADELEESLFVLMDMLEGGSEAERVMTVNMFMEDGGFDEYVENLENVNHNIIREIQTALAFVWSLNYEFTSYDICEQSGLSLDFKTYVDSEIMSLLFDIDKVPPFTKIAYKNLGSVKSVTDRLRREMIIATLKGESQDKILKRIQKITGQKAWQARRVTQTERTRVQSQGRYISGLEAQSMGVELDKQWVARLINTRERHEQAHLETVAYEALFSTDLMYPGDQNSPGSYPANLINCHCYMKPMVKSVSPALARHREKFKNQSFKKFEESRRRKQI